MCGVDAANKAYSCTNYFRYAMMVVRVVAWGVAIGAFKMGQTESSLWGYSCSDKADQIQGQVHSFLNFGTLCTTQVSSSRLQGTIKELTKDRVARGAYRFSRASLTS